MRVGTTRHVYYPDWSEDHPVAAAFAGQELPVYLSLDDAVDRIAGSFAPDVPSREWTLGWLASGRPLGGMRLIRSRS